MLTLVFYPYVYLLARVAFLEQSVCAIEVSRTLGRTPWQSFLHVRVAAGAAGDRRRRGAGADGNARAISATVQYFGVDTFTTGIYRTWLGMGEPGAAAQLAALLLLMIFVLLVLERWSRGRAPLSPHVGLSPRAAELPAPGHQEGRRMACLRCCRSFSVLSCRQRRCWPGRSRTRRWLSMRRYLRLVVNTMWLATVGAALTVIVAGRSPMPDACGRRRSSSAPRGSRRSATASPAPCSRSASCCRSSPSTISSTGWRDRHSAFRPGLLLSGTLVAVVFGYVVRFLAVALNPIEAGLARVTPSMAGAARVLGAGPTETLVRVHAPLVAGGIMTAAILVLVEVIKELPATLIMRPFNFDTLAIRTYQLASDERLAEAALPAMTIVVVGIIPVIILSARPGAFTARPCRTLTSTPSRSASPASAMPMARARRSTTSPSRSAPGELLCLVGPSGCGKTTLLRIAAGLEPLQAGRIVIDGCAIAEPSYHVPPEARGVGFVFQDYALFPHLTVRQATSASACVAWPRRNVRRGWTTF